MSDYTPKVGDRVRATLGETVLVGSVIGIHKLGSVDVRIEGSASLAHLRAIDDWQFEPVVGVPTKFGAVVKREDGRVFVRDVRVGENDRYPWSGRTRVQGYLSDEQVSNGGFTVLFEGVDE